ncbi:MAG: DNA-binding response regulator [Planctomycetota bacterium]|nr:MAG: DNA-binding response regulator [Planctomycetota bacterium]
MSEPITVYLVDDQTMIRAAFAKLLEDDLRFQVAGDSGDARAAIQEIKELRPEVTLLDITMPGLSGLDMIPKLLKVNPRGKLLMLSHHEGESFVKQALEAGAHGYLSKYSDPDELTLAIKSVREGQIYLTPKVAGGIVANLRAGGGNEAGKHSRMDSLTAREREVFLLLAIGRSNKEVAAQLNLSLGTVKKHRENLQRKLDCHSSAELARLAIREGLLDA